jgi:hypothetical protein
MGLLWPIVGVEGFWVGARWSFACQASVSRFLRTRLTRRPHRPVYWQPNLPGPVNERIALLSIVIVESGSGSTLNAGQMSRLTP